MKREGHKALVHTAAASNLGQMLNKICNEDGIGLVNIVRSAAQAEDPEGHRRQARRRTPRPPSFHGRPHAGAGRDRRDDRLRRDRRRQARQPDPHRAWRSALNKTAKEYSRYGSTTHKQVYIYGGLNTGPIELTRNYGMAWGVGGWLLTPFLQKIGRPGAGPPARARGQLAQDHLREPLHQDDLARRGARSRQHRRLQQARDRREVPDQPEQGAEARPEASHLPRWEDAS